MSAEKSTYSLNHPDLSTVIKVEWVLKNMEDSAFTIKEVKKKLPEINNETLKVVINYLDLKNKIYVRNNKIAWIENNSPKLRLAIERGLQI